VGTHFIVQLQNRPGALATLARSIANRGINIEEVSAGGTGGLGYASITTSDDAGTRDVLRGCGYEFVEGSSVLVEVADVPGALASVAERLGSHGISIHGAMVVGRRNGRVELAVTVDDEQAARKVLGLT